MHLFVTQQETISAEKAATVSTTASSKPALTSALMKDLMEEDRYDTTQTPYQRLMESEHISQDVKDRLEEQHAKLNPFALKRAIEQKFKHIFKFVTVTSNVRQRL